MPLRLKIGLVIGAVMFVLGVSLALQPVWNPLGIADMHPLLRLGFTIFFLVKGYLYLRQAWRRPRPPAASPRPDSD